MVFYRDEGSIQIAQFESCCAKHEPPGFTALIDEAEVVQTDITDAYGQVVRTDELVTTMQNPVPGHYVDPTRPWAWTLADNHPVKVDRIDPEDQGWFHVRPESAKAP